MPKSTPQMRANRSADRRITDWTEKIAAARVADQQGNHLDDKQQWGTLMGWLMSESKHLNDHDRRQMFAYLMQCARQMNEASRVVPGNVP